MDKITTDTCIALTLYPYWQTERAAKMHPARHGQPNEVYSEERKVPEYQYDLTLGW